MTNFHAPQQLTYDESGKLTTMDGSPMLKLQKRNVERADFVAALGEAKVAAMETDARGEAYDADCTSTHTGAETEWAVRQVRWNGQYELRYEMRWYAVDPEPAAVPPAQPEGPVTIRAFRGFDSHRTIIIREETIPAATRAAFFRAVDAKQIQLPLGFAQDAVDIQFDPATAPPVVAKQAATEPDLYRKCRQCGQVALHTTAPRLGCDDCV